MRWWEDYVLNKISKLWFRKTNTRIEDKAIQGTGKLEHDKSCL